MTLTPFQVVNELARRTGVPVRLPYGSEVIGHEVTEACIKLAYWRNRVTSRRGGLHVEPVAVVGIQATLQADGSWTFTQAESPVDGTGTVYVTRDPRERAESLAWARECYRPGTDRSPMDGAAHDFPTIP